MLLQSFLILILILIHPSINQSIHASINPSIHPLLHGLSAGMCPMLSSPTFSTCRDHAPSCWVCGFLLLLLPWCRPTILCTISSNRLHLHHSKHQLLHQPIVLHPHYICPNRSSFLSTILCTIFFLHRTLLRTSSFVLFCSNLILNILIISW